MKRKQLKNLPQIDCQCGHPRRAHIQMNGPCEHRADCRCWIYTMGIKPELEQRGVVFENYDAATNTITVNVSKGAK